MYEMRIVERERRICNEKMGVDMLDVMSSYEINIYDDK